VWCYSNVSLWNLSRDVTATLALGAANMAPHHAGAPVLSTAADLFCEDAAGTLDTFKLVLNGQDRFKEQTGKYFNQVQPYNHHSGVPTTGVYCYSFALKPEEHQPTGTCNFSRIDNAQVASKLNSDSNNTQEMFAVNYNVLRIQSGMGGLAFSN